MMILRRLGGWILATSLLFSCAAADGGTGQEETLIPQTLDFSEQVGPDSWVLEKQSFGEYTDVAYYTVDGIIYCTHPTNPDEQSMRFYVPEAYLHADGTMNTEAEVNGYTALTAPIIYLNNCSGYTGGAPWEITSRFRLAGVNTTYQNGWYLHYLQEGFVLVFVGERGKQTYDEAGNVIGVAPIHLADLKAGVRFLKHNAGQFPGDPAKIISNGVSAGGNMSALLGVTGNSTDYDEYLQEMGAYMGEDADDSVFATQAYCPITDLDHAAFAYEWMWFSPSKTKPFRNALGEAMAEEYARYINALNLRDEEGESLTLDVSVTKGGSFYAWLIRQYEASYEAYAALYEEDTDAQIYDWLTYADGKAEITDLDAMIATKYLMRMKAFGSFDPLDRSGDNAVFGLPYARAESADSLRHFTLDMLEVLKRVEQEYPEDTATYFASYEPEVTDPDIIRRVNLYNPYRYIGDDSTVKSSYFRICVGTKDTNTSPTVSAVLALLLQNAGYDTEYLLMWNQEHYDADLQGAFEDWVNQICKE